MDKETNKPIHGKKNNDKHFMKNKKRMISVLVLILSAIVFSIVLGVVLSKKGKAPDIKPSKTQDTRDGDDEAGKTVEEVDMDKLPKDIPKKLTPPKVKHEISTALKLQTKKAISLVESPVRSSFEEKPPYEYTKRSSVSLTPKDITILQALKEEDFKDMDPLAEETKNLPLEKSEDDKQPIEQDRTENPQLATEEDKEVVLLSHVDNKPIDKEFLCGMQDPVIRPGIPPCFTFPNGLKSPPIAPFDVEDSKYKWEVIDLFSLFKKSKKFAKYKDNSEILDLLENEEWEDLIKQHFMILYCNPNNIMDKIFVRSKVEIKREQLKQGIHNICDVLSIPKKLDNISHRFIDDLYWFGDEYLREKKLDDSIRRAFEKLLPDDYYKTPLNQLQDTYKKSPVRIEDGCDLKAMNDDEKNAYFKCYTTYRLINIMTLLNDLKTSLYQSSLIEDEEKFEWVLMFSFDLTNRLIKELEFDGMYHVLRFEAHSVVAKDQILAKVKDVLASRPKPIVSTGIFGLSYSEILYDIFSGKEARKLWNYKVKDQHTKEEIVETAEIVGKIGLYFNGIISDLKSNNLDTEYFIFRSTEFKFSSKKLILQTASALKAYNENAIGYGTKDIKYLKEIADQNSETYNLVMKNSVVFAAITTYNGLKECMECPDDDISNSKLLCSFDDFVAMVDKIMEAKHYKSRSKHYKMHNYIALNAQHLKLKQVQILIDYRKELQNTIISFLTWVSSKDMVLPTYKEKISINNYRHLFFALTLPIAHRRHMRKSATDCSFRKIAKMMNDTHKILVFTSNKTFEELDMEEINSEVFENESATEAIEILIQNQKSARVAFDNRFL